MFPTTDKMMGTQGFRSICTARTAVDHRDSPAILPPLSSTRPHSAHTTINNTKSKRRELVSPLKLPAPKAMCRQIFALTKPQKENKEARCSCINWLLTMKMAVIGFPAKNLLCSDWRALDAPSTSSNLTYTMPPGFFLQREEGVTVAQHQTRMLRH